MPQKGKYITHTVIVRYMVYVQHILLMSDTYFNTEQITEGLQFFMSYAFYMYYAYL